MITVAIVEDSPSELKALREVVNEKSGLECVGAWETAETALKQIPILNPDVVIVDLNLPRMQGVRLIWELKHRPARWEIIVHSIETEPKRVYQALQAGARGYLVKGATPGEIREAIQDAVSNGSRMTPTIARLLVKRFQQLSGSPADQVPLTPRQEEVLQLIVTGYSNKEVAKELRIGVETAKTHIREIYAALQVHSRAEVIAWWHGQRGAW